MSGDNTDDKGTGTGDGTSTKPDDKATKSTTDVDTGTKPGDADEKDKDTVGLRNTVKALRKERDDLVKAQRDAELAKLPELERAQSEALELRTTVEKLTTENMRYATAMKLGLPWSIGKRLTGDTPEEMEADGLELAKTYKVDNPKILDDPKNKRPPNDAKRDGGTGKPDMNALLRAMRG